MGRGGNGYSRSVQKTLEAAGIDFIPPQRGVELLLKRPGRASGPCELLAAGRLGPFAADAFQVSATEAPKTALFAGQEGTLVTFLLVSTCGLR